MLMGSKDFKVFRLPLWPGRPPSEAVFDNLRPSPRLSVDSRPVSAPFMGIWDMQLCPASKWTLRLSSAPLAPERTWSPERKDWFSSLFPLLECPAGWQDVSLMKCRVCLQWDVCSCKQGGDKENLQTSLNTELLRISATGKRHHNWHTHIHMLLPLTSRTGDGLPNLVYYLGGSDKYTKRTSQLPDTAVSYILFVLFNSMFTETDLTIEPNYLTPISN